MQLLRQLCIIPRMNQSAKVLEFPRNRRSRSGRSGSGGTQIPKGLTLKEVRRLWTEFSKSMDERGFRNRALFAVWLETGLRVSELARLKYSDSFESDDGARVFSVKVKGSKAHAERYHTVAIAPDTLQVVKEYHNLSGIQSDILFLTLPLQNLRGQRKPLTRQGLYKIVRSWNAMTRSNKAAHPHSLRATAGQIIGAKYGLNSVCQVLNHSSPRTTLAHYLPSHVSARIASSWREIVEETGAE